MPYLGRLLCNNGMSTAGHFKPLIIKHSSGLKHSKQEMFERLVAYTKEITNQSLEIGDFYNKWKSTKVNNKQAIELFKNSYYLQKENKNKREQSIFEDNLNDFLNALPHCLEGVSLWEVYNSLTRNITHNKKYDRNKNKENLLTFNKTTFDKLDRANKVCTNFFKKSA